MKISDKALSAIRRSKMVKPRLMIAFRKGSRTIELWFKSNSFQLTTATAIAIIKEETGLTEAEILTEEVTR